MVLAAAFPEWCSSLVLLEGGGPLARNAKDCARHVRAACQRRLKSNRTLYPNGSSGDATTPGVRVYRNLGAAIEARLATTQRMPGDQYLSLEAAKDMVVRATTPARVSTIAAVNSGTDGGGNSNDASDVDKPVTFRHDPRLQWPSLQYYTREQVEAFYHDICESSVPVCLLSAEDGWPADSWSKNAIKEILKPGYVRMLRGSHHFHADPDTVDSAAEEIVSFMKER